MTFILAVLNALVAIPKIAGYVESFASIVVQWYVSRQTSDALSGIADAAALAARASTDEERYAATEKWRMALSHSRFISP